MASLGLRLTAGSSRAARLAPALTHGRRVPTRNAHHRKGLKYPIENGLGDFLSPDALKMIAVDYQQGLLDRLNEQVRGTVLEGKSVVQTVVEAAQDPDSVLAFNYASEALNNSFFLDSLTPPSSSGPSNQALNSSLSVQIRQQYGSLEQLKSSLGAASLGMFSSGWLWFVCDNHGDLAICPTFGPGTLLVRSRTAMFDASSGIVGSITATAPRAQSQNPSAGNSDKPAPSSPVSGVSHPPPPMQPPTQTRTFFSAPVQHSYKPRPAEGFYGSTYTQLTNKRVPEKTGDVLYPLFCVSLHEHAWVGAGYGVWGKEEYMKRFWTALDWAAVSNAYDKWTRGSRTWLGSE